MFSYKSVFQFIILNFINLVHDNQNIDIVYFVEI